MLLRQLARAAVDVGMGRGALAGVLLAWNAGGLSMAQSALPPGPVAVNTATQVPTQTPRNFVNKHHIQLPIRLDDSARSTIQGIHLYSKETASAPWALREKADAKDSAFITKVNRDGEYYFAIVTIDKQGRSFPSNLDNEPPGLIVVVDTTGPKIELTNLGVSPQGQLIQCTVVDTNLDTGSVRLAFQGGDKVFRNVDSIPGQPGVYCIPSQAVFTGLVRATANDLAGNPSLSETHVNQMALPESAAPKPAPVEVAKTPIEPLLPSEIKLPRPLPASVTGAKEPTEIPLEPLAPIAPKALPVPPLPAPRSDIPLPPEEEPAPPSRPNRTTPTLQEKSTPLPKGVSAPGASAPERFPEAPVVQQTNYREPAKCQYVNVPKIFLDYQVENVGQSGVGKVEVWLTPDQGKHWHKLTEDPQRNGPLEVRLPGEGLFGITLVAANGRGVPGKTPSSGDIPDAWIQVDSTSPIVQITDARVSFENKQTAVIIRWLSKDANAPETPVDLYYGATPKGPWLPIAKGLVSDGETRWTPPTEIGVQAYLRIESRDRAGNVGSAVTMEPVQFDDASRPRAVIRTIRTEGAAPVAAPAPVISNGPALLPTPTPSPNLTPTVTPSGPVIIVPPPSVR